MLWLKLEPSKGVFVPRYTPFYAAEQLPSFIRLVQPFMITPLVYLAATTDDGTITAIAELKASQMTVKPTGSPGLLSYLALMDSQKFSIITNVDFDKVRLQNLFRALGCSVTGYYKLT